MKLKRKGYCVYCNRHNMSGSYRRVLPASALKLTHQAEDSIEGRKIFRCDECEERNVIDLVAHNGRVATAEHSNAELREMASRINRVVKPLLKKQSYCPGCGLDLRNVHYSIERYDYKQDYTPDNIFFRCSNDECFIPAMETMIVPSSTLGEQPNIKWAITRALLNTFKEVQLTPQGELIVYHGVKEKRVNSIMPRFCKSIELGKAWYLSTVEDTEQASLYSKKPYVLVYKYTLDLPKLVEDFIEAMPKEELNNLPWDEDKVCWKLNEAFCKMTGFMFDIGRSPHMQDLGGQIAVYETVDVWKYMTEIERRYTNNGIRS